MKIAIHQPQYLPWLPYFLKIEECERFIFLDTVDFQKNGLQNRNQIKMAHGEHWLTVPIKQQLGQKICDVKINNNTDWCRKHWQTLLQCYRKAPAFKYYAPELEAVYAQEWLELNTLNKTLITLILRWMEIDTSVVSSSQMIAQGRSSELVLNLCLEAKATHYLSGMGGQSYLDSSMFTQSDLHIIYRPPVLPERYPQLFPQAGFINSLSVLDILFNCGSAWRKYLPREYCHT